MKTRTKQYLLVFVIVVLALAVYSGSVFAQTSSPSTPVNRLQWIQQWLGPEAWAQRVERMTQLRGAEFVSQRMAFMAQQENCPCTDGACPGMQNGMMGQGMMGQGMMGRGMMGQGMMQQQPNGTPQGMMGRGMMRQGMMGRGMQQQGGIGGSQQPMGPRFWNNTPTATPTPVE